MAAQYELKTSKNGMHYFNLLATNGEVILTSQMYASKSGAKKGIASVQTHSRDAGCYERRQGKGGKSHFVVKARNHRVIATSQVYSSKPAMEKGIRSATTNGKCKKIVAA